MARDEKSLVTPEAAAVVLERCGNQCEHCFTRGVHIHHKKYRSRGHSEPKLNDPENLCGLCPECHERTHRGDPAFARYRTKSWQEVGESEADA